MRVHVYFTPIPKGIVERFWSQVDIQNNDSCWHYLGSTKNKGYGTFRQDNKLIRAHRMAYILTYGNIPEGYEVLHSCDQRSCCNPLHLHLGDHLENMKEMIDRNPKYLRVTPKLAERIRVLIEGGWTQVAVAKLLKLSQARVSKIYRDECIIF